MDEGLTRRSFLRNTGVAAAVVGVAAAVPVAGTAVLEGRLPITDSASTWESAGSSLGPLTAHLKDARTGEISVYIGTREVTIRDRDIARRLLDAAR